MKSFTCLEDIMKFSVQLKSIGTYALARRTSETNYFRAEWEDKSS